jgi:RNA recognition motif-containing protein
MSELRNKIFVGNVPFQCTKEDFQECFKHLIGFDTVDIIRRYKSKLSRGFGFVVFDTEEHALQLLDLKEMDFKNRTLRFSSYNNVDKNVTNKNKNKNKNKYQIYVNNLDTDTTHAELTKSLIDLGISPLCFVNNQTGKKYGIINASSLDEYNKLIDSPPTINGIKFDLKPYNKEKKKIQVTYINTKVAYNEGYKAGHLVGFQQGFQQSQVHKNNVHSE